MSSAAMRLRQAKAQPCFNPLTTDGSAAGITMRRSEANPLRAEHSAGAEQDRWYVVDAVDDAVGDRRRRTEHDDEHDHARALMEQDDRKRNPSHRRHRLEAGDHRADRGAQHAYPRDRDADGAADEHGDEEAPTRRASA